MKKIGIVLMTAILALQFSAIAQIQERKTSMTKGMVKIPVGYYQPFLQQTAAKEKIKIPCFYLDKYPVTNKEFLIFVKANPQWSRSEVKRLFADENYLAQWKSDFEIGNREIDNSPVTNVSWFAAKAYAQWKGKRLPTMQEWEYAAQALPIHANKAEKLTTFILNWYSKPTPKILPNVGSTFQNIYGVYDMHGLIWEWVYDFNGVVSRGGSGEGGAIDPNYTCAAASLKAVNKTDYAAFMRFAFRESLKANYTIRSLGFRCAKDAR